MPASSAGTPIAASTRLGFMLPDEQALPADTEMPARSSCTSWLALATPGMRIGADGRDARRVGGDDHAARSGDLLLRAARRSDASRGIASAKARHSSAAAMPAAAGRFSVPRR